MLIFGTRDATNIYSQQASHQAEGKEYGGDDRKQIHRSIHPLGRLMAPGFLGDGGPVSCRLEVFNQSGGFVTEFLQGNSKFRFKPCRKFRFKVREQFALRRQVSSEPNNAASEIGKILFRMMILRGEHGFFHFIHFVIDGFDHLMRQFQHALNALDQPVWNVFRAFSGIQFSVKLLGSHHPTMTERNDQSLLDPYSQGYHVFRIGLGVQIDPSQHDEDALVGGETPGLRVFVHQSFGDQGRKLQFFGNPFLDFLVLVVPVEPGRFLCNSRMGCEIKWGRRGCPVSRQLSRKNPGIVRCHNAIMDSGLRKSIVKWTDDEKLYRNNQQP